MELSRTEKILILGYYLYEKRDSVEVFAKKLSSLSSTEFNVQNFNYEITKIRISDPNLGLVDIHDGNPYHTLWEEYCDKIKLQALKSGYLLFKRGLYKSDEHSNNQHGVNVKEPEYISKQGLTVKRNPNIALYALEKANHQCEADCENLLFYAKSHNYFYTEGHHLIPLKYQSNFKNTLDIKDNIISLCPQCHRKLHHGREIDGLLLQFFEKRHDSLKRQNLIITIEELLVMYL